MKLDSVIDKVEAAVSGINGVTLAGTEPLFRVQRVKTKGDDVIGMIEKSTGDMFVIQVQKVKKKGD